MKEGKNRVLAEVWGWVWRLALAVVIAQAVHLMVFQPVSVKGESMTDTLQNGEIMYVSKPEYLLGDPARGDVVICHYPGREENFVKRVIGLPGDVVEIRSNQVYVNGEPLIRTLPDPGEATTTAFRWPPSRWARTSTSSWATTATTATTAATTTARAAPPRSPERTSWARCAL